MNAYTVKARYAWYLVLVSYCTEIALLLLMTGVYPPEGKAPNLIIGMLLAAPLLPFAPFLLRRGIRAHVLLCFFSLFYFFLAVPSGMDPRYGWLARIEVANTFLLFVSTMSFARFEQRRLGISVTR